MSTILLNKKDKETKIKCIELTFFSLGQTHLRHLGPNTWALLKKPLIIVVVVIVILNSN
jgi:hypothetical protein